MDGPFEHSLALQALCNLPPEFVMLCHYCVLFCRLRDLSRTHTAALIVVVAAMYTHCVHGAYVAICHSVIIDVRSAFRNLQLRNIALS